MKLITAFLATLLFSAADAAEKPLKVFILAGQSNMEGHGIPKSFEEWKVEKAKATGVYYRLMMAHVKKMLADPMQVIPNYDTQQGYELAGFVWLQESMIWSTVTCIRSRSHFARRNRSLETRRVQRRLSLPRLRENLRADGPGIR